MGFQQSSCRADPPLPASFNPWQAQQPIVYLNREQTAADDAKGVALEKDRIHRLPLKIASIEREVANSERRIHYETCPDTRDAMSAVLARRRVRLEESRAEFAEKRDWAGVCK